MRDPEHPRTEIRCVSKAGICTQRGYEGLLEAVIRVVRPDGRDEEAIDVVAVLIEQSLERRCPHRALNDGAVPGVRSRRGGIWRLASSEHAEQRLSRAGWAGRMAIRPSQRRCRPLWFRRGRSAPTALCSPPHDAGGRQGQKRNMGGAHEKAVRLGRRGSGGARGSRIACRCPPFVAQHHVQQHHAAHGSDDSA